MVWGGKREGFHWDELELHYDWGSRRKWYLGCLYKFKHQEFLAFLSSLPFRCPDAFLTPRLFLLFSNLSCFQLCAFIIPNFDLITAPFGHILLHGSFESILSVLTPAMWLLPQGPNQIPHKNLTGRADHVRRSIELIAHQRVLPRSPPRAQPRRVKSETWLPRNTPLFRPRMALFFICFPDGSDGRELACNAGDPSSIHGWGRSPGEGNGSPLQCSCLENPMDRGAWRTTVMGLQRAGHDWAN